MKTVVHCWKEGPSICLECRAEVEYLCEVHPKSPTTGSSCMLENGHVGEHEFAANDEILVTFKQVH